jgi:hypothetical protein
MIELPFKSVPIERRGKYQWRWGGTTAEITTVYNVAGARDHILKATHRDRLRMPSVWFRTCFYGPAIWLGLVAGYVGILAGVLAVFSPGPIPEGSSKQYVMLVVGIAGTALLAALAFRLSYAIATRCVLGMLASRKAHLDRGTDPKQVHLHCFKVAEFERFVAGKRFNTL